MAEPSPHDSSPPMPPAARGVTRPHGLRHMHDGGDQAAKRPDSMAVHHQQTLWCTWAVVLLGVWLIVAPFSFGPGAAPAFPSGGRSIWFPMAWRGSLMAASDIVSGILLVVFGLRALTPGRSLTRWAACFVGIWLNAAPIVFWAPTAAGYLNDTLTGVLVIALTVLIPGMPGMLRFMEPGPQVPLGWSYNPSSWPQRWIMIGLAFAGWLVSRYLAAYQLGYIDDVFEPFFGRGSRLVLDSQMSHLWPVSDAAFGAFAYTFEFLMGWMGGPARWRTMPWMVTFFGILVIPLGLVHILLVISQPVVVGHWCTLCLVAAAIMLPMLPLEADEVAAMGQYMVQAKRNREPLWYAFWQGSTIAGEGDDERTTPLAALPAQPGRVARAAVWGMSAPWTLIASAALGLWVMFAPAVFGLTGAAGKLTHPAGALLLVCAVLAFGEVLRAVRYANLVWGAVLAVVPWFLTGTTTGGLVNGLVCGLAAMALALPRGRITERYGLAERLIR